MLSTQYLYAKHGLSYEHNLKGYWDEISNHDATNIGVHNFWMSVYLRTFKVLQIHQMFASC